MADMRTRVELRLAPELVEMVDGVCRLLGVGRSALFAMAAGLLTVKLSALYAAHPGLKRKDRRRIVEDMLMAALEDVRRAA